MPRYEDVPNDSQIPRSRLLTQPAPAPAPDSLRVVQLNVDIPADLHKSLKLACLMQDISLKALVTDALHMWLAETTDRP